MKTKKGLQSSLLMITSAVIVFGVLATPFALQMSLRAESVRNLRAKTEALEKQIEAANKQASRLKQRASSLKEEIEALDRKIAKATAQIKLTSLKIAQLEKELDQAEKELERQKELLKASMRALYKRTGASTVELLIGSDSFSEFIDEQVYLERLKLGIHDSANRVIELKQKIEARQNEQIALKKQQEAQRELVKKARAEQSRLLAETQGMESKFRARSAKLQKQQAELLAEIVARSRVLTGLGTGSYPWANYRGSSWAHSKSCSYPDDGDPWGYCFRQCTSFAAWRLYAADKTPPKYYGNAENWDNAAKADGIDTGTKPRKGAIAVWNGAEGHVAFVEEILGNGEVRISEYNAVPALKGKYSQRIISADDPSIYIYFE